MESKVQETNNEERWKEYISLHPFPIKNMMKNDALKLDEKLKNFVFSQNTEYKTEFLDSKKRKWIHICAEELDLIHQSEESMDKKDNKKKMKFMYVNRCFILFFHLIILTIFTNKIDQNEIQIKVSQSEPQ